MQNTFSHLCRFTAHVSLLPVWLHTDRSHKLTLTQKVRADFPSANEASCCPISSRGLLLWNLIRTSVIEIDQSAVCRDVTGESDSVITERTRFNCFLLLVITGGDLQLPSMHCTTGRFCVSFNAPFSLTDFKQLGRFQV